MRGTCASVAAMQALEYQVLKEFARMPNLVFVLDADTARDSLPESGADNMAASGASAATGAGEAAVVAGCSPTSGGSGAGTDGSEEHIFRCPLREVGRQTMAV